MTYSLAISLVWTVLSATGLVLASLVVWPARSEYYDSLRELFSAARKSDPETVGFAVLLRNVSGWLYRGHVAFLFLHSSFLVAGLLSLYFPAAQTDYSQTRAIAVTAFLLFAKVPSLTLQICLFMATRCQRRYRNRLRVLFEKERVSGVDVSGLGGV